MTTNLRSRTFHTSAYLICTAVEFWNHATGTAVRLAMTFTCFNWSTGNADSTFRPCIWSNISSSQFSSALFSLVQFSSALFISVQFSSALFSSVQFSSHTHNISTLLYSLSCFLQAADFKDFFLAEILNAITLRFPVCGSCLLQPDLTELEDEE